MLHPSPSSSTLGISPNVIPPHPHPRPPAIPPLALPPPNRPRCVMFPSLCPCVLIVQHPLMSENMWCLVFCSCVFKKEKKKQKNEYPHLLVYFNIQLISRKSITGDIKMQTSPLFCLFLRQGLPPSSRLKCSGTISAHCNLCLRVQGILMLSLPSS